MWSYITPNVLAEARCHKTTHVAKPNHILYLQYLLERHGKVLSQHWNLFLHTLYITHTHLDHTYIFRTRSNNTPANPFVYSMHKLPCSMNKMHVLCKTNSCPMHFVHKTKSFSCVRVGHRRRDILCISHANQFPGANDEHKLQKIVIAFT